MSATEQDRDLLARTLWGEARAFVIRLGFKVQPDDAGTDGEPVGMTTKINFYKAI